MIKFEFEGKEFEFKGRYEEVKEGDYFLPLNHSGGAVTRARAVDESCKMTRAIVHPVEKYHDFGGVRFKETGEVRTANEGEWWLGRDGRVRHGNTLNDGWSILEPVEILPK